VAERHVYTVKVRGSNPLPPTKMKKIIVAFSLFFLIFFLIGLFSSKKEKSIEISQETQKKHSITVLSTSNEFQIEAPFILFFEKKTNEEIVKLTENLKPDPNKNINDYNKEIAKIRQKIQLKENMQNINPQIFIDIAKELSKINPPPTLYNYHLELIKNYYKLGLALKEFYTVNDSSKKILLYNLIIALLKNIQNLK
jgi:hypothetical protein